MSRLILDNVSFPSLYLMSNLKSTSSVPLNRAWLCITHWFVRGLFWSVHSKLRLVVQEQKCSQIAHLRARNSSFPKRRRQFSLEESWVSWNRILSHAFDHTYADNGQSLVLRLKRLYAGQVARYSLDHLRLDGMMMARRLAIAIISPTANFVSTFVSWSSLA